MNEAYRVTARKIDPSKGLTLPDGTLNDQDRIEIGPTPLAYAEWEAAGLILPDLHAMRAYRLSASWTGWPSAIWRAFWSSIR
jgi:Xaa-Pro dipeptidase